MGSRTKAKGEAGAAPTVAVAEKPAVTASMAARRHQISIDGSSIVIEGAVRGLVDERARIVTIAERETPDLVALSISPEELDALLVLHAETKPRKIDIAKELSTDQEILAVKLEEFGEVDFPPPCFTGGLAWAKERETPVVSLDLDETAYTDAYGDEITFFQYVRHDRRRRKLEAYKPQARTAAEFVLEWDRLILKLPGFARLEARRERQMADRLLHYARLGTHKRILAIVDLERADGIAGLLAAAASSTAVRPPGEGAAGRGASGE